jgi:ketosteroid isomerase-like protein
MCTVRSGIPERVLLLALSLFAAGCRSPGPGETESIGAIESLILTQEADWNRGDLAAFMKGYIRSEDLRFVSGGQTTEGWEATFERYTKKYGDRAKMGSVKFTLVDVALLAPDVGKVVGKWRLTRENDSPGGMFTLILRRTSEGWRIVHDHTSIESSE